MSCITTTHWLSNIKKYFTKTLIQGYAFKHLFIFTQERKGNSKGTEREIEGWREGERESERMGGDGKGNGEEM